MSYFEDRLLEAEIRVGSGMLFSEACRGLLGSLPYTHDSEALSTRAIQNILRAAVREIHDLRSAKTTAKER